MTTLGELTPNDIGKMVRISGALTTIEGQLLNLQVETDWIVEQRIGQHPDDAVRVPGRRSVMVMVGPWMTDGLATSTKVVFL